MEKDDYSIDWKSDDPRATTAVGVSSQPLSAEEISRIEGYAGRALKGIREVSKTPVGYDAASVKQLSDEVDRIRKTLDAAGRTKIANIYGAFLGKALIEANPNFAGRWVRVKSGDVAICFDKAANGMTIMAMPITRTFKHIDEGSVSSIFGYFQAMPEVLAGPPAGKSGSAGQPVTSTSPRREQDAPAIARLGRAADGTVLDVSLPQGQCCNCGKAKEVRPEPSPMRYRRALDGKQIEFTLELPYCNKCRVTAGRYPKSLRYKAFGVFVAYAVFIFVVLLPLSTVPFFAKHGALMLLLFTLGVVATFYWIRRTTPPQTSAYQPVRLIGFQGETDGLRKLSFRFSNSNYGASFAKLNRTLIGRGLLSV